MPEMTRVEPPSRAWRVAVVLIVGPALVLAYKTGSRISAEREVDTFVRTLDSTGPDGRPDPRALVHVERGSGALIAVLERMVREGPFENRASIARALGFSRRLECLRELVLELRDGCVDPELVALPRPWPCAVYPPDELALETGEAGTAAMEDLAREEDAFLRGWGQTFIVASGKRPLDGAVLSLLNGRGRLAERAGALAVASLGKPVDPGAVPALVALLGETSRGRVAAALLARGGATLPAERAEETRALAAKLSPADEKLVRDPRAVARASRALLERGDARAAEILGELASVDSGARAALVAAVESSSSVEVRDAARRALR
jgi:hypothetical protein